jgi:hypothetical protein
VPFQVFIKRLRREFFHIYPRRLRVYTSGKPKIRKAWKQSKHPLLLPEKYAFAVPYNETLCEAFSENVSE